MPSPNCPRQWQWRCLIVGDTAALETSYKQRAPGDHYIQRRIASWERLPMKAGEPSVPGPRVGTTRVCGEAYRRNPRLPTKSQSPSAKTGSGISATMYDSFRVVPRSASAANVELPRALNQTSKKKEGAEAASIQYARFIRREGGHGAHADAGWHPQRVPSSEILDARS